MWEVSKKGVICVSLTLPTCLGWVHSFLNWDPLASSSDRETVVEKYVHIRKTM